MLEQIKSLHFGKESKDFSKFITKTILLFIPGLILGHLLDQSILYLQRTRKLGSSVVTYAMLQTLLNISLMYGVQRRFTNYSSSFQRTLPGVFFVCGFFNIQTNYMDNLKRSMGVL